MAIGSELRRGILVDNPVLVLLLGLCPTLAVTTGLANAIGMGLAATFVLICSNFLISLVKAGIPKEIRIPVFIVVIATFVTVVKLAMFAYFPAIATALGIFLPLIVVNCIILGRAEAYASRNKPLPSVVDGLVMGLGFTVALCIIGTVREIVGTGMLLGRPLVDLPRIDPYTLKIMIIPPGGFLTMGLLLAFFNYVKQERAHRAAIRRTHPAGPENAETAVPEGR